MADGYIVVKQEQTVGKLPDNTFGSVVRVTFRTTAGTVLAVDVPTDVYSVDTVKAAIEERVAHSEAIDTL